MTKLNENERAVLEVLAKAGRHTDYGYLSFAGIADRGDFDLDRKAIRRACRSLARKGLAHYGRGLWTEDGETAGSGYCALPAGVSWVDETKSLEDGIGE